MAIAFRSVTCPPLRDFTAAAPDGAVIGVIGENGSGKGTLLRIAAGVQAPLSGSVEASGAVRYIGPNDSLALAPSPAILIEHAFARQDALVRERAVAGLARLRRAGVTVVVVSHEEDLLRRIADEVWWLRDGRLAGRGDPAEILGAYQAHIAEQARAWGETVREAVAPRVRRGDGRAAIVSAETLGENGRPTMTWRSGEAAAIRIRVQFHEAVPDPVIGILIRTRTGLNVYGTNTELENLRFGPCAPGETVELEYAFRCDLCPGEYILTMASHDPGGEWHDWLDDALAFTVTDSRYTAGVANLHANVKVTGRTPGEKTT